MKNARRILIISLLAVMAIVSLMPSTFSWYNHEKVVSGEEAEYSRTALPVSAGAVTATTNKLRMQSNNLDVYLDDKGDVIDGDSIGNATSTINGNQNQYYRTKLTNSSNSDAMVSLYALGVTNASTVYIGTTMPTVNERSFSARASRDYSINPKNRIYFSANEATGWDGSTVYIMTDTQQEIEMNSDINDSDSKTLYYADLPFGVTSFYFFSDADDGRHGNWFKTEMVNDHVAGNIYKLTKTTTDDNLGYANYTIENSSDGLINVSRYYDSVHMILGQTASIALESGNYSAKRVSYSIDANSYLNIDSNSGLISYKSGASEISGTVQAHITLYGLYNDSMTLDVNVSSPPKLDAVAVCTNIKVPANDKAEVQWYVKNKGSGSAVFDGLYLTQ